MKCTSQAGSNLGYLPPYKPARKTRQAWANEHTLNQLAQKGVSVSHDPSESMGIGLHEYKFTNTEKIIGSLVEREGSFTNGWSFLFRFPRYPGL